MTVISTAKRSANAAINDPATLPFYPRKRFSFRTYFALKF